MARAGHVRRLDVHDSREVRTEHLLLELARANLPEPEQLVVLGLARQNIHAPVLIQVDRLDVGNPRVVNDRLADILVLKQRQIFDRRGHYERDFRYGRRAPAGGGRQESGQQRDRIQSANGDPRGKPQERYVHFSRLKTAGRRPT